MKQKEALLLKKEVDKDDIVKRLEDFEDDTSVAGSWLIDLETQNSFQSPW